MKKYFSAAPVIVGGVGGSGTRIIAEILKQSGIFMGSLLNVANDNMQLAKKFPYMRDIIQDRESINQQFLMKVIHLLNWKSSYEKTIVNRTLEQFEKLMFIDYQKRKEEYNGWGWKVPGNYFILKHTATRYKDLKYIHIMRNGLDMAFSSNQNQLTNWGKFYGVDKKNLSLPRASLNFWYAANKRAILDAKELLNNNFLLIRFEELCFNPEKIITDILNFINIDDLNLSELIKLVKIPDTIDRYKNSDLTVFNKEDFNKLKELGYNK
jgi:hypothetical protein